MNSELLEELGIESALGIAAVEYAQECLRVYEETLFAMGICPSESVSQAVDNSQLKYANPSELKGEYAKLPEHH